MWCESSNSVNNFPLLKHRQDEKKKEEIKKI